MIDSTVLQRTIQNKINASLEYVQQQQRVKWIHHVSRRENKDREHMLTLQ